MGACNRYDNPYSAPNIIEICWVDPKLFLFQEYDPRIDKLDNLTDKGCNSIKSYDLGEYQCIYPGVDHIKLFRTVSNFLYEMW